MDGKQRRKGLYRHQCTPCVPQHLPRLSVLAYPIAPGLKPTLSMTVYVSKKFLPNSEDSQSDWSLETANMVLADFKGNKGNAT